MLYYRLNDKYALRKYTNNIPMLVIYGKAQGRWQITENELMFLIRCDGVTPFDKESLSDEEKLYCEKYMHNGVISEIDVPNPIKTNRAYQQFNHKRIALANWTFTLRCNLNCLHCLNLTGSRTGEELEMPFEDAKIVIDRLAEYGVERVKIFGGEPLVYNRFLDIIRLIQESGMEVDSIDTNGLLIKEDLLDEIEKIGAEPSFSISFDGLGTHDWMRNKKGCEEPTIRAIKLCLDRGYKVTVSINVNRRTLPVVYDTVRFFKKMGCKHFKLLRTSETFRWQESEAAMGEKLTIPTKEFASMLPQMVENLIEDIRDGIVVTLFNEITIGPNATAKSLMTEALCEPESCTGWCPRAENGIFIGCEGHVVPCSGLEPLMQYHGLLTDRINILKNSLEDILYSDLYNEQFRITRKDIWDTSIECQTCDKWNVCNGGICRLNALLSPQNIGRGIPLGKEYLSDKDYVYCFCQKEGYIDEVAQILEKNLHR